MRIVQNFTYTIFFLFVIHSRTTEFLLDRRARGISKLTPNNFTSCKGRGALSEKCPNTEFFLVHIFPHSDWIQRDTDAGKYGQSKCGKIRTRKNSVFGHFSRSLGNFLLSWNNHAVDSEKQLLNQYRSQLCGFTALWAKKNQIWQRNFLIKKKIDLELLLHRQIQCQLKSLKEKATIRLHPKKIPVHSFPHSQKRSRTTKTSRFWYY